MDLSAIEDRLAIQELNNRYAVYIDLHEIDNWVNLFMPDALFDEREFDSPMSVGRDQIRAYGEHLAEIVEHAVHHMTTHTISDLTSTSATGVAFASVEAQLKDGFHARHQVIYLDRYKKVDGSWMFSERILRKSVPPEIFSDRS